MWRAGWVILAISACGGPGSIDAGEQIDGRMSAIDARYAPDARIPDAGTPDAVMDAAPDAWIDAALAPPIPELPDAGPPGACTPGIDAGPPEDAGPPVQLIAPCCDDGDGGLVLPTRLSGSSAFILSGGPDSRGDTAAWRYRFAQFDYLGNDVRWQQDDGSPGAWVDDEGSFGELIDDGDGSVSFHDASGLVATDVAHVEHFLDYATYQKTDGTLWDTSGILLATDPVSFVELQDVGWPMWLTDWDGSEGWLHAGDPVEGLNPVVRANRYDAADRADFWWDHWDPNDPMPNGTLWSGGNPFHVADHALAEIGMDPNLGARSSQVAFWTVEHLADGEHLVVHAPDAWDLGVTARPVALRVDDAFITFVVDDEGPQLYAGGQPPVKLGHRGVSAWVVGGDLVGILYPGGLLTIVPKTGGTESIVTTNAAGPLVATLTGHHIVYVATDGSLHQVALAPCTDVVISPTTSADPPVARGDWILWKTASNDLMARTPETGLEVDVAPEVDLFVGASGLEGVYFTGTSQGSGFYSKTLP